MADRGSPVGASAALTLVLSLAGAGAASALPAADEVPIVATLDEVLPMGTVVEGLEEEDALGASLLEAGDVDGDGREDIAFVGRHRMEYDARILLGLGGGRFPGTLDLGQWGQYGIDLVGRSRFPCPQARLGDMDGDGSDDLAFSVAWDGSDRHGAILFGGSLPLGIDADTFAGVRTSRLVPGSTGSGAILGLYAFGSGDFDGDGLRDLAAATRFAVPDGETEGLVFIVPGTRPFPGTIRFADVGAAWGARIRASGESGSPPFAWRIAAADFDGDGLDDLLAATPGEPYMRDEKVHHIPAVLVVFGRRDWPAEIETAGGERPGICRLDGAVEDERLGDPILMAGDLTGDGVPDILVSADMRDEPGCFLVSGKRLAPGRLVLEEAAEIFFASEDRIGQIADLGDWDGDGRRELAFGLPFRGDGSVVILPVPDPLPARVSTEDRIAGRVEITGTEKASELGGQLVAMDIDGDGLREVIATAPGFTAAGPEWQIRGRLAILHGGSDFLGPLEGIGFAPRGSELRGGGVLQVWGRGFDSSTAVLLDDVPLEVLVRPDSRRLLARIPPWAGGAKVKVRLRRGPAAFVFPDPFDYIASPLPLEVDLGAGGDSVCLVRSPRGVPGADHGLPWFEPFNRRVRGGHDFTGDGLADVLFAYKPWRGTDPVKVFLLHGARDLPRELHADASIEDRATVIRSEVPFDFAGTTLDGELSALLIGDMTGDGRSELAIGSAVSAGVYLIAGHEAPAGPATVQALLGSGRGCWVGGIPRVGEEAIFRLLEAGDVDGDGLRDLAIQSESLPLEIDGAKVVTGCLALVLGRRTLPPVLSYGDLPKVHGTLPLVAGTNVNDRSGDGVGDIDGDGFDDIVLHVMGEGDEGEGFHGAFSAWYLLFGRKEWPALTTMDREIQVRGACEIVRDYRWTQKTDCSADVAGIGDEDRDGKDDLGIMVGRSSMAGISYVFRLLAGRPRPELDSPRDPRSREGFDAAFPSTPVVHERLMLMRGGRDLNGDQIPDALIGDNHSLDDEPPARAIVLFGGDLAGREAPLGEVGGTLQLLYHTLCPGDQTACYFPDNFHFAGDVNGDRYEDLVAGGSNNLWIWLNPLGPIYQRRPFRRGDANSDGLFDLSDAVAILGYLFLGAEEPACLDAADIDDDERLDIADPIRLLGWLFLGGEPPAPPRECASDPEGTDLDCRGNGCL